MIEETQSLLFNSASQVLILRHGSQRVATNLPESPEATLSFAIQQFPSLQLPIFLTRNVPEVGGDVKITEGVWTTGFISLPGMLVLDVHETQRDETSEKVKSEETESGASGSVSKDADLNIQERLQRLGLEIEVGPFRVDGDSKSHRFRVPLDATVRDVRRHIAKIHQVDPEPLESDDAYRLECDGVRLPNYESLRSLLCYGDEPFLKLEVQVPMVGGITEEDRKIYRATGKMPEYRDKLSQLLHPLPTDPYLP